MYISKRFFKNIQCHYHNNYWKCFNIKYSVFIWLVDNPVTCLFLKINHKFYFCCNFFKKFYWNIVDFMSCLFFFMSCLLITKFPLHLSCVQFFLLKTGSFLTDFLIWILLASCPWFRLINSLPICISYHWRYIFILTQTHSLYVCVHMCVCVYVVYVWVFFLFVSKTFKVTKGIQGLVRLCKDSVCVVLWSQVIKGAQYATESRVEEITLKEWRMN